MLTHKIRDMPQHMFENKPPSLSGDDSTPLPPSLPQREQSSGEGDQQQSQQQLQPQLQQMANVTPQQIPLSSPQVVKQEMDSQPIKREPTETELPLPKRPPSK